MSWGPFRSSMSGTSHSSSELLTCPSCCPSAPSWRTVSAFTGSCDSREPTWVTQPPLRESQPSSHLQSPCDLPRSHLPGTTALTWVLSFAKERLVCPPGNGWLDTWLGSWLHRERALSITVSGGPGMCLQKTAQPSPPGLSPAPGPGFQTCTPTNRDTYFSGTQSK